MSQLPPIGAFAIPGHELGEVLKHGRDRLVLRTTLDGREAVTRVLAGRLDHRSEPMIQEACRGGRVSYSTLPRDLSVVLEGYQARAHLRDCAGLPEVLGGGLTTEAEPGSGGGGFAGVTTEGLEGTNLDAAAPEMDAERRGAVLCRLLGILEGMHGQLVGHGDLKPGNVVVGEDDAVHLIDLDTLRIFPAWDAPVPTTDITMSWAPPEMQAEHQTWLSSDIWAFGAVSLRVLTGSTPGDLTALERLEAPWDLAVRACLRPGPFLRPRAKRLLRVLRGHDEELLDWFDSPVDEAAMEASAAHAVDGGTVRVTELAGTPQGTVGTIRVGDVAAPPAVSRIDDGGLMVRSQRRPAPAPTVLEPEPTSEEEPGLGRVVRGFVLGLLGIVVVGLLGAAGVGYFAWAEMEETREATEQANAAADALRARLRDHKIVRDLNTREEVTSIRDAGAELRITADSDRAVAVHALAFVWAQGWHYSRAKWDEEAFAEGEAVTRAAIERTSMPEALLAHGLLTGAACRLAPESSFGRKWSYCQESRQTFDQALTRLPRGSEEDWLWIEVLWASVVVDSSMAFQHRKGGKVADARADLERAARMCGTAWDRLEGAPINGDELAEDCISVAGGLNRYDDYMKWSLRVLSRDPEAKKGRRPSRTALRHVLRGGHAECAGLNVDANATPQRPDGATLGGSEDLCEYLYYVALGCPNSARASRPCKRLAWLSDRCVEYWEVDALPWSQALRVDPLSAECLLQR